MKANAIFGTDDRIAPFPIICEYLPEGSLHQRLHKVVCEDNSARRVTFSDIPIVIMLMHDYLEERFSWEQRCGVLRDTYCALAYLHAVMPPLVHQDVKSNVHMQLYLIVIVQNLPNASNNILLHGCREARM